MSDLSRAALRAEVVPLAGRGGGVESELKLCVPSDVALVEEAVELVAGHLEPGFADPHAVRFNLRIALTEALTNGMLYGNLSDPAKAVAVRARFGRNVIELEVTDEGDGFDPRAVPDPRAPDRLERPYGRGLYLIRSLMDEVRYNEKGNSVCMILRRASKPSDRADEESLVPPAEAVSSVAKPAGSTGGRLEDVLAALGELLGERLRVWSAAGGERHLVAGESGPAPMLPASGSGATGHPVETARGRIWLEPVPEHEDRWLEMGPGSGDAESRSRRARAAAAVVGELLRGEHEVTSVAGELATRYEEIDLLYTISDILGSTVRLEEAARTIARELAAVVGARRASIMVHDQASDALHVVAGRGLETYHLRPVPVSDPDSIAAHVFRDQAMLAFDDSAPGPRRGVGGQERGYKSGNFLSLPITYAPPGGTPRKVGVINLTDRIGADAFTASHKRLLAAVASQVGAAIENARLMEGERLRVRMDTELALAHELQSALMQPASMLAEVGDIGARIQSADAVGGDFYRIVSLRSGGVGVMLGDVSSHGLAAAMIMAHAIAAAGIVAQTSRGAGQALERLLAVIGDELARTEMHLAVFYGIIDRRRGVLSFANAGHPQAFLLHARGRDVERLEATAPPLGLGTNRRVRGARVPWRKGENILCLFSDGISDAVNAAGERYGEARLLSVVRREAARPAPDIVDAVFRAFEGFVGRGVRADDSTLVVVRS